MTEKQRSVTEKKLWQICLSFGLSLGVSIYLLGPLLGGFLDQKLGSSSVFTIIGVLLAIACCFYRLFRELRLLEQQEKDKEKK